MNVCSACLLLLFLCGAAWIDVGVTGAFGSAVLWMVDAKSFSCFAFLYKSISVSMKTVSLHHTRSFYVLQHYCIVLQALHAKEILLDFLIHYASVYRVVTLYL